MAERHSGPLLLRKSNDSSFNVESSGTRLAIVEHEALVRAGLVLVADAHPEFTVCFDSATGSDALDFLARVPVDVLLIDFHLGGVQEGMKVISKLRDCGFAGRFIVVAGEFAETEALIALRAGVSGLLLKSDSPEDLCSAIKNARQGGFWMSDRCLRLIMDPLRRPSTDDAEMSVREVAVLRGVLSGLSNKEIAGSLGISEAAVKGSLQRLFRKTSTRNRSQLSVVALERYGKILGTSAMLDAGS